MTPNEVWESHVQNGFVPDTVEPELRDDLFRPYEIRTVRRGIIEWNTNEYFSTELESWNSKKVIVGYDIDDASKVWVRKIDITKDGETVPGALICVAVFAGNKVDYVPKSYQKAAEEKRRAGRLARLNAHVQEVEAEARADLFLEAPSEQPINIIPDNQFEPAGGSSLTPARAGAANSSPEPHAAPATPEPSQKYLTPRFSEDWELAAFALENGLEALTKNQRSVLSDCLNNHTDREILRMKGIDPEELLNLFRAAA